MGAAKQVLFYTPYGRKVLVAGILYTAIVGLSFAILYTITSLLITVIGAIIYTATIAMRANIHTQTLKKQLLVVAVVGLLPVSLAGLGIILVE